MASLGRLMAMEAKGPIPSVLSPITQARDSMTSANNQHISTQELARMLRLSIELPQDIDKSKILKLAHDLTSASNAFGFLIDELTSPQDDLPTELKLKKLTQLRSHHNILKSWVQNLCDSLLKSSS